MQTAAATQPSFAHIPLSQIITGNNPRRYFDQSEMAELAASVRAKGVIQPISVNVVADGKYMIIAGERRFRAACAAELTTIPAIINKVDEGEAEAMALVENIIRANMSPTEEAVAAGKVLAKNNNDRDETARELGWLVSKLNRRLALLNLVPEVMDALNERRILLGHAELLAAVPQDKQPKALQTIIAMDWSVQKVREQLLNLSTAFKDAIFDTAGCEACKYNSERQGTLFTESIETGRCTDGECYKTKTRQRIEAIRDEVIEEVQNVKIIEIGDATTYVTLTADGALGVGSEQHEACLACANYGATVSALPGEEGKVERSVCFDADCHRKKVAERVKTEKAANQPIASKEKGQGASTTAATKATTSGKKAGSEKKASELSERVKEYRRKQVWEPAAKKELASQLDKARAFVLDLFLTGDAGKADHLNLSKLFGKISGSEDYPVSARAEGYPEKPYSLDPDQQDKLFAAVAVSTVGSIEVKRLQKLLGFLEADLGKHWKIDQDFLSLLTKSEIEAVCKSVGLDTAVKDFSKVMTGKKDEAIQTILKADFQFEGAVPSLLNYA